eukprot:310183_1
MSTRKKYILTQKAIKARYSKTASLHGRIKQIEPDNYACIIAKATTNDKCIKFIHKHSSNLCKSKIDSVPPPIQPANAQQKDVGTENKVKKIMSSMQRLSQPNKSIAETLADFNDIYGDIFSEDQIKIIDGGYDDIFQIRSLLQKLEIQKGFLFGIGEPAEGISKIHKLLEFFEKYLDCGKEDKWSDISLKDARQMIKYSFNIILAYEKKKYHTKDVYKRFQGVRMKIPAFSAADISAMEIRDNAIESLEEADAVIVHEQQKMVNQEKNDENKDENKDTDSERIQGDKDSDRDRNSDAEDEEKDSDSVDDCGDAKKGKNKRKVKSKKGKGKGEVKGKNKVQAKGKGKGKGKDKGKGKNKGKGKGKGKNHGGLRRGWDVLVEVRKPSDVLKSYQTKMGDEKGLTKFKIWIDHNGVEVDDWARAAGGDEEENLCESLGLCND